MAETLKVGLVGCGRWGINCLRDLKILGCEVHVVAVSEESLERARDGGASQVVASLEELDAVDGIVVASPTSTHAQVVEDLLDREIPIFVEKPLTDDLAMAEKLISKAPELIFVMDKWRYHPGVEALRDLVRSGELGNVIGLRTTRMQWQTNHSDVDAVWILAPHDLSICMEILGYLPEPVAAVGELVDGRLEGLIGQLGGSPWFVLEISARYHRFYREIRLSCEKGIAILDDSYSGNIQIVRTADYPLNIVGTVKPELRAVGTELPLLRELRAFTEHLSGGPPPKTGGIEALRSIAVLSELRRLTSLV